MVIKYCISLFLKIFLLIPNTLKNKIFSQQIFLCEKLFIIKIVSDNKHSIWFIQNKIGYQLGLRLNIIEPS